MQTQQGFSGTSEHFEASCLCGGITLSYTGPIGPANYCHCEDCRRANGSAFNLGVRVERKQLQVTASTELKAYKYLSDSGRQIERCFCGSCGSPIFTLHPAIPDYAWVKAGIINDPTVVRPAYENWIKDKVEWATVSVTESYEESRQVSFGANGCVADLEATGREQSAVPQAKHVIPDAPEATVESANKSQARRLLEKVINQRRLDSLAELMAPDCVCEPQGIKGLDGYRQHVETFLHVYPDLEVTVDGQMAEGDIVATWFTARGTHQGEWQGIPPTHRRLLLKGVNIQRFRNGQVVEHWGGSNSLEALLEIGIVKWSTTSGAAGSGP